MSYRRFLHMAIDPMSYLFPTRTKRTANQERAIEYTCLFSNNSFLRNVKTKSLSCSENYFIVFIAYGQCFICDAFHLPVNQYEQFLFDCFERLVHSPQWLLISIFPQYCHDKVEEVNHEYFLISNGSSFIWKKEKTGNTRTALKTETS